MDTTKNSPRGRSAIFEAREPSGDAYKGAERRRSHRRGHNDRRVEMRFEMDKPDRRVCAGRRSDDKKTNFW